MALPLRRVRFDYPDDLDPAWIPHAPEFACAANSVSLLMPYAEPYFVRSVRAVLPDLEPDLRRRTEEYIRQESQHQAQHRKLNAIIEAHYPRVRIVERWMARTCTWLADKRSTRFNLAFAAGAETIAFSLARWTEHHLGELFDDADPVASTLFLWHLAEEVEHKTAAWDAYAAIDGSRLRYALAMTMAFLLLGWFTAVGTFLMLLAIGRAFHPVTIWRYTKWAFSLAFEVMPIMLVSALPGHDPSDLTDPVYLSAWLAHYDPATGTLPVWNRT